MESIFNNVKERMKKTIDVLNKEYCEIRAGRANPAILDKISVDYYGTATPISQVASVSVTEARVLTIQPWDISMVNSIEKAIQKSDIGINPQNDGKVLRLIFPQLNEDMRKNIAKDISKMAEDSKIAIRSIRRDAIDQLKKKKKDSEITEDELKSGEKNIQIITDKSIEEIEKACNSKSSEIMKL